MPNKSKDQGKSKDEPQRPPQHQTRQPGIQAVMDPEPVSLQPGREGSGRLKGRVAVITGGDSGIGKAVALTFAREGASVFIIYLSEHEDARRTAEEIAGLGGECEVLATDIGTRANCADAIEKAVERFGKIDILVNNAAEQHPSEALGALTEENLTATFRTNVFAMFYVTQAALPHLRNAEHPAVINTTSVTAYRGSPHLVDYSATKGAIVSFTRSLSQQLASEGIRVNAVAPGPIWTPLIPATFPAEEVAKFGSDSPLGRAGQPWECAECFLFLASTDSSYITGQVIHPNGGEIING